VNLLRLPITDSAAPSGRWPPFPQGWPAGSPGERDGYAYRVATPDTRESDTLGQDSPDTMWCLTLNVEVRRTGEPTGLDPDDGLRLTAHVARDVFTRLVLNAPNLGFPGALLNRERQTVTIDGQPAPIDHAKHHDPNSVTLLHDQVVSLDDLQIAVTGTRPPSPKLRLW